MEAATAPPPDGASPVAEVEARLEAEAGEAKSKDLDALQAYIGTAMPCLGHSVPHQRRLFRQGYGFAAGTVEDRLGAWDQVWHGATYYETRSQACFFLERVKANARPAAFPTAQRWVKTVDNWVHSDVLSSFFVQLLDERPGEVYPLLQRWNTSSNPWERRQSVVSLIVRARSRKAPLAAPQILQLVEPLLADADHFVQRGVGWTLREAHELYPDAVGAFVIENAQRLSAVAFATASKKYERPFREDLKRRRKAARQPAG